MATIFVNSERAEVRDLLLALPAILAGKVDDVGGIARGFKLRLATAFFSVVKDEFIVKSRGGTDGAGISWPPLTERYLAYQRGPPSTRRAGRNAPGGNDGFMTAAHLRQWNGIFAGVYARLSSQIGEDEAAGRAAAIAWQAMKKKGVKTKLEVFGSRDVEILRDRGILFNAISPGQLTDIGPDASYSAPPDQVVDVETAGTLIVGVNVDYAKYHQGTPEKPGRRPLWPVDGVLPEVWWDDILDAAVQGLLKIGEVLS